MSAAALALCLIVGVPDGNTLTGRCAVPSGGPEYAVNFRLADIDAPKKPQPFGIRSQENLSTLCLGRLAKISREDATTDRRGINVSRVQCQGADASAQQVRAGMAWVLERNVADRALHTDQAEARAAHRGLWIDPNPIRPWKWRATQTRPQATTSSTQRPPPLTKQSRKKEVSPFGHGRWE